MTVQTHLQLKKNPSLDIRLVSIPSNDFSRDFTQKLSLNQTSAEVIIIVKSNLSLFSQYVI
jgi:hypothetical protein